MHQELWHNRKDPYWLSDSNAALICNNNQMTPSAELLWRMVELYERFWDLEEAKRFVQLWSTTRGIVSVILFTNSNSNWTKADVQKISIAKVAHEESLNEQLKLIQFLQCLPANYLIQTSIPSPGGRIRCTRCNQAPKDDPLRILWPAGSIFPRLARFADSRMALQKAISVIYVLLHCAT